MPSAAGMAGMMKRNTITTPWSVNTWLYVSGSMIVRPGVKSSMRTSSAKTPPNTKNVMTEIRYMMPIRLWSSVMSHDMIPFFTSR